MEGSGRNAKDVSSAVQANDVERIGPGQIHQIKRSATTCSQKIVLLVRVKIKLPGSGLGVIGGTDSRPGMHNKVSGIGCFDRHIKESDGRSVPETLAWQTFKH